MTQPESSTPVLDRDVKGEILSMTDMGDLQTARGGVDPVVLLSISRSMVNDLVMRETCVVADVTAGRTRQDERLIVAIRFLRDVLTIAYVHEAAWELGCQTVGDALKCATEVFGRAAVLAGFDPREQIALWMAEGFGVRGAGKPEHDKPLLARPQIRELVSSIMENTKPFNREAVTELARLDELDRLLATTRKYLRRSDAFLAQRLSLLAGTMGLSVPEIAAVLELDEADIPVLIERLELAPARRRYVLPEGETPPSFDNPLSAEDTAAHLRWLESGADGPDPCLGSSG